MILCSGSEDNRLNTSRVQSGFRCITVEVTDGAAQYAPLRQNWRFLTLLFHNFSELFC